MCGLIYVNVYMFKASENSIHPIPQSHVDAPAGNLERADSNLSATREFDQAVMLEFSVSDNPVELARLFV